AKTPRAPRGRQEGRGSCDLQSSICNRRSRILALLAAWRFTYYPSLPATPPARAGRRRERAPRRRRCGRPGRGAPAGCRPRARRRQRLARLGVDGEVRGIDEGGLQFGLRGVPEVLGDLQALEQAGVEVAPVQAIELLARLEGERAAALVGLGDHLGEGARQVVV